jgi:hypothetical protein
MCVCMCAHEKGKESDGKNQQTRLGVEGDGKKVLVPGIGPIFLSLFLGFNKLLNDVFCLLFCGVNIPFLLIYVLDN